jgi:hypothetical protein
MGLSIDKTKKVAELYAKALSKADGSKCTVNTRTLEEDSFDIDCNGEEFDGGSYTIQANGDVVNAAVPGSPVYGKWNDSVDTIVKNLNKLQESITNEAIVKKGSIVIPYASSDGEFVVDKVFKNKDGEVSYTGEFKKTGKKMEYIFHKDDKIIKESSLDEANLVLGLSTNNYPAGTIGRYRIESSVINLRKVADLSKDSWKKYSRAFADDEIGFEKANDRKEALAAIQKSFDNGQNDIREFGLNESVVNETGFKKSDIKKTIDFINKEIGTDPGYALIGDEDDIEEFDKLWNRGEYEDALELLTIATNMDISTLGDVKDAIKESVVNERNITIKRQYTDKRPAVTVGKAAKVRNKMLEAIKDGKLSQEDFNNILKEMTTDSKRWLRRNAQCFNVSEDGITLSKTGSRILKNVMVSEATTKAPKIWVPGGFDKAIAKYPNSKITRKIVLDAALKWDVNPEDAIKYVEYAWVIDLDENKNTNDMTTKFIYESFADFVANKLNEGTLNEAFKSAKLANLFSVGSAGTKDLAGAFYNFSKLAIDKIEDYDIIEMDPQTARKEKRANGVYFYIVTNQKENPYIEGSIPSTYNNGIIQSNTLLAITNGSNEWYSTSYQSYSRAETLKITKTREDAAGFDKRDSKRYDGSGITSLTKVAELADTVYVIDLDVLKARYSTQSLQFQRAEDKRGATAFKSDKDFKAENKSRYNQILAQKASEMPMDSIVLGAIDTLATQIKDALTKAEKGRYGELIVGLDPKGREIKMSDASNLMRNILDEYNRYVGYAVDAEKEVATGYSGKFYEGRLKESSKTIVDYVKKVEAKNYAW